MNSKDTISMVYQIVDNYFQTLNQNTSYFTNINLSKPTQNTQKQIEIINHNQTEETVKDNNNGYEFELLSPFPKKVFNVMSHTLEQAKLVPNAILFLR